MLEIEVDKILCNLTALVAVSGEERGSREASDCEV